MSVFRSIIDSSTMLQRLEVELTGKGQEEMVYYALERRGNVLKELTIGKTFVSQSDNFSLSLYISITEYAVAFCPRGKLLNKRICSITGQTLTSKGYWEFDMATF